MTDVTQDGPPEGPLMAADGTPLKSRLTKALFRTRLRAFGLTAPLLGFIFAFFFLPIAVLLFQAVHNDQFEEGMPRTTLLLADWNGPELPSEEVYAAVAADLIEARKIERSLPTKVGARVNREISGATSTFKKTTRKAKSLKAPFKDALIKIDKDWGKPAFWYAMKRASESYTASFLLKAVDLQIADGGGIESVDDYLQIHVTLFLRTMEISIIVTVMTLILGYPIAYLLAGLPVKTSNLLLILVLLPFWTSILVRTTAWIAILQSQGALNDIFVWIGIASDDQRFSMIYNKLGTLIAMTHILLPFMVLPLYSVMKAIPPTYVRAARSLGATGSTAFWRVYFPQSVPGIGAGGILVFILAIGYYITPALLGGQDGIMISNIIDGHMRSSLNYSLAAALGLVLLVFVLLLFWLYDRIVGIDNMKLG